MVGIASLAQAVVYPLTYSINVGTISGPNSYIYQTAATLDPSKTYTSATLSFNNVKFTAVGGDNTLNYDLLNGNIATTHFADTGTATQTEGQDWFEHQSYNWDVIGTGGKVFALNQTLSWNETFSPTALADLLNDIKTYGSFDLGFDPNCTYQVGTVTLTLTTSVPDQAGTLSLLGLTFVGLLAFRRKFCIN